MYLLFTIILAVLFLASLIILAVFGKLQKKSLVKKLALFLALPLLLATLVLSVWGLQDYIHDRYPFTIIKDDISVVTASNPMTTAEDDITLFSYPVYKKTMYPSGGGFATAFSVYNTNKFIKQVKESDYFVEEVTVNLGESSYTAYLFFAQNAYYYLVDKGKDFILIDASISIRIGETPQSDTYVLNTSPLSAGNTINISNLNPEHLVISQSVHYDWDFVNTYFGRFEGDAVTINEEDTSVTIELATITYTINYEDNTITILINSVT